ncbi:WASH complex subunit 5 isoform X2 [Prorops nasuta]|uniref:WASH complex subunit 5 isoform X2 n=1 Tax=Prorops nasuta TaxID=863751 RepID=UPI0034CF34D5
MNDFLINNNVCGQNLLHLVSRGNAIISELMRLKDHVPPVFRLDSKILVQKYGSIIIDFSYFTLPANSYEQRIENDLVLQEVDEELRNNYVDILNRFYLAFESIYKYITDLNLFIEELEDGVYVQQSLDTVMLDDEGKQLMCEALYLYGVMLLIMDYHFEGSIRERLLVSYYRYSSPSSSVHVLCKFLCSTGFSKSSQKRTPNYPEDYFRRVPINESFIELAISRLRTNELYNQSLIFPHPQHRSTALSSQASMLVVILSFKPSTLRSETAVMREIVDRFFPDNWVISIYMGIIINLWDWWQPYKAARTALNNTLETVNVKDIARKYGTSMEKLIKEANEIQLTKTFDEITIDSLVKFVRNSNATLHWILLHTAVPMITLEDLKRTRTLRQLILTESKYSSQLGLKLLLSTAKIEQDVKQTYKELLSGKEAKWLEDKNICVERIKELDQILTGDEPLDEVKNNLHTWFKKMVKNIESLKEEDSRKIPSLLVALEKVQEFHQLENNLHISQHLAKTREILHSMLRTGAITENTLTSLNIMTDCCYLWNIMESFIDVIQNSIKENPPMVIKLKALFLKMASGLETPLLRINQAGSTDLSSVSQYYSRELEGFARRVLQIIPETVFGLLAQIVRLETDTFKEIPSRLHKDKLKDYAQLNERLQMAKLTYDVSVFTEGVLSLRSVSLGILRVDSHLLLEGGIRQELVKKITLALHNGLFIDSKAKVSLLQKLHKLASVMDGYRKSFQYIQDYININSLKIWHEEITFIINNAVEEERKGISWVPGKLWNPLGDDKLFLRTTESNTAVNFMGHLTRELIRITDPKTTVYIEHTLAWYELKTQTEVVNQKLFSVILEAVGTPGLSGLDQLISFSILVELENLCRYINKNLYNKNWKVLQEEWYDILQTTENDKVTIGKLTNLVNTYSSKVWSQMLEYVLKIGQCQVIRRKIAYELNTACKFEAKHMEASLQILNRAILSEISEKSNNVSRSDKENKLLLRELSVRLNWAGINDPCNNVYIKQPNINNMALIMFLFTISQLNKLHYSKTIACLISKKIQDPVDAIVFTIGIQTMLHQFDSTETHSYIKYLSKYILTAVATDSTKLVNEVETEASIGQQFLELFIKYSNIRQSVILKEIPIIIIDHYQAKIGK